MLIELTGAQGAVHPLRPAHGGSPPVAEDKQSSHGSETTRPRITRNDRQSVRRCAF